MNLSSKLPRVGTTIFTVMSQLANEVGAVNLSQGFPDFDCDPVLKDLVTKYMGEAKNQYSPMPGLPALREAIATKIKKTRGALVHPDDITVTAGGTQALYCAISSVVRAGDEVILIEPAYDSYKPVVELHGGNVRTYELSAPDFQVDWNSFSRLITHKTRLIIINNPHNPLGKTLSRDDLEALNKLVSGTDIMILSDEVYEHIVFDGKEHHSVLSHPELKERSFAVFSFGKTFHITGWKMGYCVAPEPMTREFRKVHQFNVFAVNTPAQFALAEYLKTESNYLGLPEFFQAKRDYLQEGLQGTRLKPISSEGSYFQLYDYSAIADEADTEFAKRMTREYGVAAIPVSVFYSSGKDEKVIRLCFAKKEETLGKAIKLLKEM